MNLSENEYKKILFLTRTNISEARIKRLGKYFTDFNLLLDRINKLNHPDLDHDWSLFDFEYIDDKKFIHQISRSLMKRIYLKEHILINVKTAEIILSR